MSWRHRPKSDTDRGAAMIAVMILGLVLTSIATITTTNAVKDLESASRNQRRTASFQAAEAGVEDYVAKITEDSTYFLRFVHPAESTRRSSTGTNVAAGGAWNGTLDWTYPTARNAWRTLPNGYQYNLQIVPPETGNLGVKIIATGRRAGSTADLRRLEVVVRPASIADFAYVSNNDQVFSTGATTTGKVYTGIDTAGVAHSLTHYGKAYGNLYAEGRVWGMVPARLYNGAAIFDSMSVPNIRTEVGAALNFNLFTNALVDIHAAAAAGILLDDLSVDAWQLTFNNDGTVTIEQCWRNATSLAEWEPSCWPYSTAIVPANGAIYTGQSVIPQGVVNGRVTIGSNADVIIGRDLVYADGTQDVLGLIAKDNVLIASWSPDDLTVSGSFIAQTGSYRSWTDWQQKSGLYRHIGSAASNTGGYMTMFAARSYEYDAKLLLLPPPFFPTFGDKYTVVSFRELTV